MKINIFKAIVIGLSTITVCNILGHFLPPFSLSLSSVYMSFIIIFVNKPLFQANFKLTIVYNFIILLLNDIFIRLYAGGTHDNQGKGWCMLMYFLGLFITTVIMFAYISQYGKQDKFKNILIIIAGLIISVIIYWNFNAPI
jgi:hypothetical protein